MSSKPFQAKYAPQADITTYELAQVVQLLIISVSPHATSGNMRAAYESLPQSAQRHFVVMADGTA